MSVRRAIPEDAEALAGLINAAYRIEAFFVSGNRTEHDEVVAYQRRGDFLVSDDDDRLLGCVYLRLEPRSAEAAPVAHLGLLSVHPECQGRGLARELMAAAERTLSRQGVRRVELSVVDLREDLPGFYRRFGYQIVGTRPFDDSHRLLRPAAFLRMAKILSPLSAEPPTP